MKHETEDFDLGLALAGRKMVTRNQHFIVVKFEPILGANTCIATTDKAITLGPYNSEGHYLNKDNGVYPSSGRNENYDLLMLKPQVTQVISGEEDLYLQELEQACENVKTATGKETDFGVNWIAWDEAWNRYRDLTTPPRVLSLLKRLQEAEAKAKNAVPS